MRHVVVVALLIGLLGVPASGHGGIYNPPGDAGGPGGAGGGNSAPPTNPGGGLTPGAGGPGSSRDGTGAGGGRTRGGGPGSGNQTGLPEGDATLSYDAWEFWWEANKDQFLDLKTRLGGAPNRTRSIGVLTGHGRRDAVPSSRRPSLQVVNDTIVPVLLDLLRNSAERDIVDSSLLALGRVAREDHSGTVIEAAKPLLAHGELSVRTSAALALGVLGSQKAVPILNALVADSSQGRELVGGSEVEALVRALSALSLGLIDDAASVQPLIDIVQNTRDAERDLKATAIVALGLMGENPHRDDAYRCLLGLLDDPELDAIIKSYVPTSLGKLGTPDAVPALLAVFLDRDTDNLVRQSAAIGLGLLASVEQPDVVEALREYIGEGRDAQTRHFALISLAQIGRRDREREQEHAALHAELTGLFADELSRPTTAGHRSWAALAGAIYARAGGIESAQAVLVERLVEAWRREKDPSFRSAFALSLGLLGVTAAGPELHERFAASRDADERGYTAVALGFLRYDEAGEELREQCRNRTITPTFRLQVATALGLMGDVQAVNVLVETLKDAQTLGVSSAVARALGLIGDEAAVAPLLAIAQDPDRDPIARGFACVALGIVGEKTELPWNARINVNNNYRARVAAMAEVLDIL